MKFGVKKNRVVNETFFAPCGTPPTYLSSLSTNTIALVARLDRLSSSLVNLSMTGDARLIASRFLEREALVIAAAPVPATLICSRLV